MNREKKKKKKKTVQTFGCHEGWPVNCWAHQVDPLPTYHDPSSNPSMRIRQSATPRA